MALDSKTLRAIEILKHRGELMTSGRYFDVKERYWGTSDMVGEHQPDIETWFNKIKAHRKEQIIDDSEIEDKGYQPPSPYDLDQVSETSTEGFQPDSSTHQRSLPVSNIPEHEFWSLTSSSSQINSTSHRLVLTSALHAVCCTPFLDEPILQYTLRSTRIS